jgi:hypothetical protein
MFYISNPSLLYILSVSCLPVWLAGCSPYEKEKTRHRHIRISLLPSLPVYYLKAKEQGARSEMAISPAEEKGQTSSLTFVLYTNSSIPPPHPTHKESEEAVSKVS